MVKEPIMNIVALTEKIEAGIAWASVMQTKIIDKKCGELARNCGCALSVAFWADGGMELEPNINDYMEHFGLDSDSIMHFMVGFDGGVLGDDDKETFESLYYHLGVKYRTTLISK
jgi:hypothetical protein